MSALLQLQKVPGKGGGRWGVGGGGKGVFVSFLADQKITSSWKKCVLGHPIDHSHERGVSFVRVSPLASGTSGCHSTEASARSFHSTIIKF